MKRQCKHVDPAGAMKESRTASLSKVWMASSRCGVTSLQTQGRGTALLGAGRPACRAQLSLHDVITVSASQRLRRASQRFASLPALHFSVVSMLGSPKGAPALSQPQRWGGSGSGLQSFGAPLSRRLQKEGRSGALGRCSSAPAGTAFLFLP